MKMQRKENSQTQSPQIEQSSVKTKPKAKKEKKLKLQDFIEKGLWGMPVSIQDGFRAFYSRNAEIYDGDFERALLDFTKQR